jgi:fluoride exporter
MALFRMPRLDGRELAAIFTGGCIGALGRAGLAVAAAPPPGHWPWPTFTVNIAGALLLGYFVTRLQERLPLSAYRRPLLGTGLCGALTTFSTVQVELVRMLEGGRLWLACGYAVASIGGGWLAVLLATASVRRVRALR